MKFQLLVSTYNIRLEAVARPVTCPAPVQRPSLPPPTQSPPAQVHMPATVPTSVSLHINMCM